MNIKLILVVLLGITAFVGLANLAVIWNGALFVILVGPYFWAFNWWLERATR